MRFGRNYWNRASSSKTPKTEPAGNGNETHPDPSGSRRRPQEARRTHPVHNSDQSRLNVLLRDFGAARQGLRPGDRRRVLLALQQPDDDGSRGTGRGTRERYRRAGLFFGDDGGAGLVDGGAARSQEVGARS